MPGHSTKYISGCVVMLLGGAVCWKSQRQPVMAPSTTELEYIAAGECSKHTSWSTASMFDIFHPIESLTPFHINNTSVRFTATGEGIKSSSKHINRRCHHIHNIVQSNKIDIRQVSIDNMLADYLTEPLPLSGFPDAHLLNNKKLAGSWIWRDVSV